MFLIIETFIYLLNIRKDNISFQYIDKVYMELPTLTFLIWRNAATKRGSIPELMLK